MNWRIILLICAMASTDVMHAQNDNASPLDDERAMVERNLSTLETLAKSLAQAAAERDALISESDHPNTRQDRKNEIEFELKLISERIQQLRRGFRDIIGGADAAAFEVVEEVETTLQGQFGEVIKPILSALQEPTSRLREIEDMRTARDHWRARRDMSDRVISRITALETANDAAGRNSDVASELEAARRQWEARRSEAAGQFQVLSLQLEERELTTPTFWHALTTMIGDFVKNRGLNLLLALGTALAAFFITRKSYAWFRRISPVHNKKGSSLIGRASDLIAFSLAILVSILCVLLVFFARGDWLLLTVTAILLFGVIWAGKNALPPYIEQIRMLLNLGAVREGERVIYRGLPWRVESLGFYTLLENPALHGGRMRIPLQRVMSMISRKPRSDEPWFPCQQGDWVLLGDGTHGQVEHLTPEQIVLKQRGDSLKTYQASEFLELAPENLSPGFRVRSVFGIDYSHQAICTTEVPEVFHAAVQSALTKEFGEHVVKQVLVDFNEANSSSLDYSIRADLGHDAAPRYRHIPRIIQRACVDSCNDRGWIIPFTQITLHQGGAG